MRRLPFLVVLGVALAGCGGDEGLSRAEYVEQADAICERYDRAVAALPRPDAPGEFVEFADKALVELDKLLEEQRVLSPPEELEDTKRRWLAVGAEVRKDVVAVREAARTNNLAAIQAALAKGTRDDERANALARELGLTTCSAS